jgi:hypothetical protein
MQCAVNAIEEEVFCIWFACCWAMDVFSMGPSRDYIVTDLLRQLLCKRSNYATIEESGVFRSVSVAPLPLLCSAEVNTSLTVRQQL